MTIIQYVDGKWDKELTYRFSKVINSRVIRLERDRGSLRDFDQDYNNIIGDL